MTTLEELAIERLNYFCLAEYQDDRTFDETSNLSRLDVAYTTVTDYELELQTYVDLNKHRIVYEVDGEYYNEQSFESLESLVRYLKGLEFGDLIPWIPEEDAKAIHDKRSDYTLDWRQSDFI